MKKQIVMGTTIIFGILLTGVRTDANVISFSGTYKEQKVQVSHEAEFDNANISMDVKASGILNVNDKGTVINNPSNNIKEIIKDASINFNPVTGWGRITITKQDFKNINNLYRVGKTFTVAGVLNYLGFGWISSTAAGLALSSWIDAKRYKEQTINLNVNVYTGQIYA
jgi:hypothetical protein